MSVLDPATGRQVVIEIGKEQNPGEGPGALVLEGLKPNLPFSIEPNSTINPAGIVNNTGFAEVGLPGAVEIAPDFAVSLNPALLLPFLQNMLGDVTKTNPDGIFKYVLEYLKTATFPRLYARVGLPPTDNRRQHYNGLLSGLTIEATASDPMFGRFAGLFGHTTAMGVAVADGGNTGSYTEGPYIRGVLADETAGSVFVEITQDVAGGGLEMKFEQSTGAPTFPGTEIAVDYDADGNAKWMMTYNETAGGVFTDHGFHGENKDPVEIIFPGTSTEHGNLDVGDQWEFKIQSAAADPSPTYGSIGWRPTAASALVQISTDSMVTWDDLPLDTITINMESPTSSGLKPGSKYATQIVRQGGMSGTLEIAREMYTATLKRMIEAFESFAIRVQIEGARIGTNGINRDGVVLLCGNCRLTSNTAPVSSEDAVIENIVITPYQGTSGEASMIFTIHTARDYTV